MTRLTRKNTNNESSRALTISSVDGLIDQGEFFKKQVASKDISGYYLLKKGDFAYNKSYSVGYDYGSIKRLDRYENGVVSTLYICMTLNEGINSDYLTHYFDSMKWNKSVSEISAEGARNHGLLNIPTDAFFETKHYLSPLLPEQQKIADFLSTVDSIIASETKILNALQKKALMQKLFSQQIRFKADDGSEFPEWEERKLGDFCTTFSGGTPKSGTSEFYNGNIPFIRSGEIESDSTTLFLSELGIKNSSAKIVYKGDLLYALYGANSGLCAISKIEGAINQAILCIQTKENNVFLCNYLKSQREYFYSTFLQGGQGNLSGKLVESYIIPLPCKEEQQKIADCLSSMDSLIENQQKILTTWQQRKKALLQQMFV